MWYGTVVTIMKKSHNIFMNSFSKTVLIKASDRTIGYNYIWIKEKITKCHIQSVNVGFIAPARVQYMVATVVTFR